MLVWLLHRKETIKKMNGAYIFLIIFGIGWIAFWEWFMYKHDKGSYGKGNEDD